MGQRRGMSKEGACPKKRHVQRRGMLKAYKAERV